jgi:threonine synthase
VFSVPSGNFGDMMGGVIAMKMGLPVKKFVIATNDNDEFPKYLETGKYNIIVPSKNCISSAMNVGHPSNMSRLVALYGGIMTEKGEIVKEPDMKLLKKEIWSASVNDKHTKDTIKDAWKKHKLLLEPHGSVGWNGLMEYIKAEGDNKDQLYISLETAHPAKFPEQIIKLLGFDPDLPKSLEGIEEKKESYDHIGLEYAHFKKYLLKNYK